MQGGARLAAAPHAATHQPIERETSMTARLTIAGVGLAMIAAATQPVAAQTADAGATSQSINQTQVLVGSGAGGGELEYSGDYTVRSAPDAIAPMIAGGSNPCVVGMSAAGSMVGFGVSGGASWSDESCERRNLSIVLMNASAQFDQPHLAAAAIEVLCQHDDVAMALEAVGSPCITRRPQTQQATRPIAARQTAARDDGGDWDWIGSAGR